MKTNCTRFDGKKFENLTSTPEGHVMGAMAAFNMVFNRVIFQIVLLLMFRFSIWNQGRSWDGIAKIFVPGTWVPKPEIPGLLSKSLGFGCPKEFCLCTVSAIFVLVQGVPGICVSWDPSPVDLPGLKYANSRSKLWIMQELFSKMSF